MVSGVMFTLYMVEYGRMDSDSQMSGKGGDSDSQTNGKGGDSD